MRILFASITLLFALLIGGNAHAGNYPTDPAFWQRLANCESPSGASTATYTGYFQFSGDTARKVGIDGSESYEEQRAAAQDWASRIANPGSTAGWPHCWWVALRQGSSVPAPTPKKVQAKPSSVPSLAFSEIEGVQVPWTVPRPRESQEEDTRGKLASVGTTLALGMLLVERTYDAKKYRRRTKTKRRN